MKGYKFHVFVSYSRTPSSMRWVRELFAPTLQDYLHDILGKDAAVFHDGMLKPGADFDEQLFRNLADSAILIPVLTAAYFESEWCRREFSIMREREEKLGFRTKADPRALIVPAYLSGKNRFPERVTHFQWLDLWQFNNPHLAPGTQRRAEFNDVVREWSEQIAEHIKATQPHCPTYRDLDGKAHVADLLPPDTTIPAPSMIAPASAAA